MKAVYISHPFGGKAINLTLASKWVAWAARQDGIAPMAPWIVVGAWIDGELDRKKALEIDCRHVELCDELWICGPKIVNTDHLPSTHYLRTEYVINGITYSYFGLSNGMSIEVEHALKNHVVVHDMRQYGEFVL
jgi:hypothetical protein